jgi:predicted DNA-binding transcriptional regulator YafY
MSRVERALGILLRLASGRGVATSELAREFDVSRRTIHRDLDMLSALGVPVYANRGHGGGFRLLDSYFLPPVRLSIGEAISLLLGTTLLNSLPSRPFAGDASSATTKVLAALPPDLRTALATASSLVAFEETPIDTFHYEVSDPVVSASEERKAAEAAGATTATFLLAALNARGLTLRYRSPYQTHDSDVAVDPLGILWDRRRWYLVGRRRGDPGRPHLFRADRARSITVSESAPTVERHGFDIRDLLGRAWLADAMRDWARESPVVLRLTSAQAARLGQDWYYRHAEFEQLPDGSVQMTYGGDDCDATLELLRWLGPGAHLVAPDAWRSRHIEALRAMLAEAKASEATPASR